jgi:hypothetical protein
MSKTDLYDKKEEQAEAGELKPDGSSRRRFIRNIALGTAGAAFAVGNLDRLQAANRLLERLMKTHADGFVDSIKGAKGSPAAKKEFQRLQKLILDAIDGDPECRDTANAIKHYVSHPVVPMPKDAKPSDLHLMLGAGYLRALAGIQGTNRRITADDVRKRMKNRKNILHIFESGFLNELYSKTKSEIEANPAFGKRLIDADTELKQSFGAKTEASVVPAAFQCPDCTIEWPDGSITCASTLECVGLVVVVVVIFIVLK